MLEPAKIQTSYQRKHFQIGHCEGVIGKVFAAAHFQPRLQPCQCRRQVVHHQSMACRLPRLVILPTGGSDACKRIFHAPQHHIAQQSLQGVVGV